MVKKGDISDFSNPKELLYHCIGLILVVSTDIHQISKARGFMSLSPVNPIT